MMKRWPALFILIGCAPEVQGTFVISGGEEVSIRHAYAGQNSGSGYTLFLLEHDEPRTCDDLDPSFSRRDGHALLLELEESAVEQPCELVKTDSPLLAGSSTGAGYLGHCALSWERVDEVLVGEVEAAGTFSGVVTFEALDCGPKGFRNSGGY